MINHSVLVCVSGKFLNQYKLKLLAILVLTFTLTGSQGKSKFYFEETLKSFMGKGNQNSQFPTRADSRKLFFYAPTWKKKHFRSFFMFSFDPKRILRFLYLLILWTLRDETCDEIAFTYCFWVNLINFLCNKQNHIKKCLQFLEGKIDDCRKIKRTLKQVI